MTNVLFLGDIVGHPARVAITRHLPELRERHKLDLVVANAENAAGGSGITAAIVAELTAAGVDAITLGDHVWDQRGFDQDIIRLENLCRPANLPPGCPGKTHLIVQAKSGFRLAVLTLLGRQYLNLKAECPFLYAQKEVPALRAQADGLLLEIHAEATSEKIAMGWFMDGQASLVVGTHTHVQTADETILPRGTAYLTDAGMCGGHRGVIGREIGPIIGRFLDGMPRKFEIATQDVRLMGCIVTLDDHGIATCIERLRYDAEPAQN